MPEQKKEFPLIQIHTAEDKVVPDIDFELIRIAVYKALEQPGFKISATYDPPDLLTQVFNHVFDYLATCLGDSFFSNTEEPREILVEREKQAALQYVKENGGRLLVAHLVEVIYLAIAHTGAIMGEKIGEPKEFIRTMLNPHSNLIAAILKDAQSIKEPALFTIGSGGNHRANALASRFTAGQFAALVDARKPLVRVMINSYDKYKAADNPNKWIEELNKSSQYKDLSNGKVENVIEYIQLLIPERRSTRKLARRKPNYNIRSALAIACDCIAYEFELKKSDGDNAGAYFDTGTLLNYYHKDKKLR